MYSKADYQQALETVAALIAKDKTKEQLKSLELIQELLAEKMTADDKPKGKAHHKWTKEIAKITFIGKYRDGEGAIIWRKTKELILLKGAKLAPNPQLNVDGSKNYSTILSEQLRHENQDKITNGVTTEDIIFPSPNLLGIFLFYGGQNTWAEFKDENGKSLDEHSVIK